MAPLVAVARAIILALPRGRAIVKGDFSTDTFDAGKYFSRVLMQQGRVTLDSDYNEQSSIGLHQLRTTMRDLIGPFGAPSEVGGFHIQPRTDGGLSISSGRYDQQQREPAVSGRGAPSRSSWQGHVQVVAGQRRDCQRVDWWYGQARAGLGRTPLQGRRPGGTDR